MHSILQDYTLIRNTTLQDRLLPRPEGQKVQVREIKALEDVHMPDVGDLVLHVNGGPRMCIEQIQVLDHNMTIKAHCSWWTESEDGWRKTISDFNIRSLRKVDTDE